MFEPFASALAEGRRNSLGRTEEVVGVVLGDRGRLDELFACTADADEEVRMRAGDALEKVCRERTEWLEPYVGRLFDELGASDQPSLMWHLAQMLDHLRPSLDAAQAARASKLLERNLSRAGDWIVLNVTMDVLCRWAREDPALAHRLAGPLERLCGDPRRSVATRAARRLAELREAPPDGP